MRKILPYILATITHHPRCIVETDVDFSWSRKSWTHNFFRAYELIFGRRIGIRCESRSYLDEHGNQCQEAYTYEAMFALVETRIRMALKRVPKYRFVEVPVFALAGIGQFPLSQTGRHVLLAIAHDADSGPSAGAAASITLSHTCTGSNLVLISGDFSALTLEVLSSLAYAGSSATRITDGTTTGIVQSPNGKWVRQWIQVAPSTGANNNVLASNEGSDNLALGAISYTGVNQSTTVDSTATKSHAAESSPYTLATTVIASNCWLTGVGGNMTGNSGGTGTTIRYNGDSGGRDTGCDSNGTVSTGSQSLNIANDGTNGYGMVVSSIAPVATSAIKTINGLARASVKTANGLALASVKTWNGLA